MRNCLQYRQPMVPKLLLWLCNLPRERAVTDDNRKQEEAPARGCLPLPHQSSYHSGDRVGSTRLYCVTDKCVAETVSVVI